MRAALLALAAAACIAGRPTAADPAEPVSEAFLARERAAAERPPGIFKAFLSLLLRGYGAGISPADGPTCPFSPTCAGYAAGALRKHGAAEGILMSGDRVLRCNGIDLSAYPRLAPDGRHSDPVP